MNHLARLMATTVAAVITVVVAQAGPRSHPMDEDAALAQVHGVEDAEPIGVGEAQFELELDVDPLVAPLLLRVFVAHGSD